MTCVTHLECSLTGERYDAGQVHNLSRAGKPLLVRYDLEAAKRTLTRDSIAERGAGDVEMARAAAPRRSSRSASASRETPICLPPTAAPAGASG